MDIIINNISANTMQFSSEKGSYKFVGSYTVDYEIESEGNKLNGSITIQEKDIEIESLKERIREKVKQLLK